MKGFILFSLLSIIFVSDYAFAQLCPCDTLELSNGTTGNDIVELLCPGGEPSEDNRVIFQPDLVVIGNEDMGYVVESFPEGGVCEIGQEGGGEDGFKLTLQEAADCRASLIERCRLNSTPIPTLSQWGLIAMAGVLGVIGLIVAARRRKAAA